MHHSWQDMNGPSGKSQDTHMTKLAYSSGNGDLQNEKFQEIQIYEAIKSMKRVPKVPGHEALPSWQTKVWNRETQFAM